LARKITASAYAPGAISCIFRPYDGRTLTTSGSLGLGFTVNRGVRVKVRRAGRTAVIVNSDKQSFPTVRRVCDALADEPVEVDIRSQLPFRSGFGMSGASALAAAYALNELFALGYAQKDLALVAHSAEVEQGTGRGDVATQFAGGVALKLWRGEPFRIRQLRVGTREIFYRVFGPLSTKRVLGDKQLRLQIEAAAKGALLQIKRLRRPKLEEVVAISREFAVKSGLAKDRRMLAEFAAIEHAGGQASMIMLGNALFSTVPFRGAKRLEISTKGAELL